MNLGLVIPVWNDQAALTRLMRQVRDMALFDQIVVVDDGSDRPARLPRWSGLPCTLLRNDTSQGPGPARNLGLEHVTTSHVLFFDSDDLLTQELPALWQDLQDRQFDFCLFRHCDSRHTWRGAWDMLPYDQALWRAAGMGGQALTPVGPEARTALVQTANYPWNKIWRTQVLRDYDIRCSDLPVHQDIEPHWMGFLHARDILASDRVGAVHHVTPGAGRLTNLRSRERLAVFDALEIVLSRLQAASEGSATLMQAFLRFSADLLDWIHGHIDPSLHPALAERRRTFWHLAVPPALFDGLRYTDPELALRVCLHMIDDGRDSTC
ncbi:MAG: glycosyltransferase family 2 protein [Pseudomonadota bacterium]